MLSPFVCNRVEIIRVFFTVLLLLGRSKKKIGSIVPVQIGAEHSFAPDLKTNPVKMLNPFRIGKGECDFNKLEFRDHDLWTLFVWVSDCPFRQF
jgi:hypothetical protein